MCGEAYSHLLAQPGPPARDQDTLALQDSDVEHGQSSFPAADVIAISRLRPGSTSALCSINTLAYLFCKSIAGAKAPKLALDDDNLLCPLKYAGV
jgi:hypothetical protein